MKQGARLTLAAEHRKVQSLHFPVSKIRSEADISLLDDQPYGALRHGIFTAHQMGGLCMGSDPKICSQQPTDTIVSAIYCRRWVGIPDVSELTHQKHLRSK